MNATMSFNESTHLYVFQNLCVHNKYIIYQCSRLQYKDYSLINGLTLAIRTGEQSKHKYELTWSRAGCTAAATT